MMTKKIININLLLSNSNLLKRVSENTMKRTILILLLIIILSFLSGCREKAEDKNYINEKYVFTFEVPTNWENKYEIIEEDSLISFVYSECINKDWNLQQFFTISVMLKKDYEKKLNNPPMVGTLLAEKNDTVYVLYLPLDIGNLDEKQTEEYHKLFLYEDEIKKRFRLYN